MCVSYLQICRTGQLVDAGLSLLLLQSVKNLVFLGKVLHQLHTSRAGTSEPAGGDHGELNGEGHGELGAAGVVGDEEDGERRRDLFWLINRMSRLAKYEAAHHPKETMKVRKSINTKCFNLGSHHSLFSSVHVCCSGRQLCLWISARTASHPICHASSDPSTGSSWTRINRPVMSYRV